MPFDTARLTLEATAGRDMLPVTCVLSGQTVKGTRVTFSNERMLSMAGEYENASHAVRFIRTELAAKGITLDSEGNLVRSGSEIKRGTVDGNTYLITGVDVDAPRVTVLVFYGEQYA